MPNVVCMTMMMMMMMMIMEPESGRALISIQSEDMAEKWVSVQLHFLTLTFDLIKI